MEGLTKRQAFTVGGVIYAKCEHCQDRRPECFGEQCPVPDEALIRLADYEDAEDEGRLVVFESAEKRKHIQALAEADKDGRCVVLPCKVGDEVFSFCWSIKNQKYEVFSGRVKNVRYDSADGSVMVSNGEFYRVWGKTVFLTREAAEAALEAQK